MEQNELMRAILARLNEITGTSNAAAPEALEAAVFQRLDQAGKIIGAIQQYLPKRVIDKILLNPDGVKVEGERRPVTVLFGDLSGFTAMSETMDPEQVVEVVNQYFDTMVEIAERYGGHIDKFMGDALMVLFGAPVVHEDDALRACLAAVEMLEAMDRFSAERKMDLAMSIGLNTGEVVALNVGSKGRMEYTVIGDGVNLAARLEKVATARQCVIGENTYRQVKGKIRLKKLKPVMVKGKSKPQNVYLILGRVETAETAAGLRAGSIPMVGRMAEMDAIRQSVEKAKGGAGQVVAITGEPGLGKSRLAKELELLARDEGFAFVKGKCYSYSQSVAYLPFLRQLQLALGVQDKDHNEKKSEKLRETLQGLDLSEFEPFLGSLLGLAYPEIADLDPQKRKRKTFEGFVSLFRKQAAQRPLAVAFEDLQWADSLSLELLEHLVEGLAGAPILVCCDYRPELALPFIARPHCRSIVLGKLDEREVLQMMTGLANVGDVADPVLRKVAERTEGNPLFIEEITRHLLARRLVKRDGSNLIPAKRFGTMALPGTVAGVVLGRIDKLSEELRRTLQYAAVVGREFDRETLAHITKTAPEQLQQQLENMEHFEGLLYSKEVEGKRLYQFHSTATQEAAYGTLLKQRRRDLHGRVAQTYERDYHDNLEPWLEDLAHHYYLSAFEDKAVTYLRKAGDKARGLYANGDAIEFYEKGIGLLKKAKDSKESKLELAELLGAQSVVLILIGQRERALKQNTVAARLAGQQGDQSVQRKYLLELGVIYDMLGERDQAEKVFQRVRSEAQRANDVTSLARALNNLGQLSKVRGDLPVAIDLSKQALEIFQRQQSKKDLAQINGALGELFERIGDLAQAMDHYQLALSISREINYAEGMASYNNNQGAAQLMMGRIEEAQECLVTAGELAKKIGDVRIETLASGNLGIINAMLGNYSTAYEYFQRSIHGAHEIKDVTQEMAMETNVGCLKQIWGDLLDAKAHHLRALAIAQKIGDHINETEINRNLGVELMLMADYRGAAASLDYAQNTAAKIDDPRMQAYIKTNSGMLMVMVGEGAAADALLQQVLDEARTVGDPEVIMAAVRAIYELKLQQRDHGAAEEQINRALRIADDTHNQREKAYALLALAQLHRDKGDMELVNGPLAEALVSSRELKDKVLIARICLLSAERALSVKSFDEATGYLDEAMAAATAASALEYVWQSHDLLGQLAESRGLIDEAKLQYKRARDVIDGIVRNLPPEQKDRYLKVPLRAKAYSGQ